ncbi:MAG: hypothetical protein F6K55_12915 [Moorea sp. SIO4A3]|nr:hypothetical protein [Moorena sp. SIO4A3]
MNDTLFQINNISVILYAFHLCQDLTQEVGQLRQDAEGLWQNCAKLSKPLAIEELKSLPQKIQSYSTQTFTTSRYSKLLEQPLRIKEYNPKVKVEPHKIDDTYALDLTLKYNNVSKLSELNLNPQGCLLASNIQPSLGQTLVLYGEPVGTPEEDSKLADACVDAFFQGSDQKPQFMASGQLFGSPIFAYDNGKEKPTEQCHLLVWLNRHPETLNLAQKTYFSLLNLLCCRSKILFAYDQARWCYRKTRELYGQLEQEVKGFKELPREREIRLEQLKQKLTQMPSQTFDYAVYLRDMEDHKTAIAFGAASPIATNAENYDYWLEKIRESSFKDDNIEFLANFLNQRTKLFQRQIQTNLNYLKPGQQLFDQMLGSIRGIVETEQAQQEKRLERWIASVGIGLAVSGISSQTDAKPVESIITQLYPKQFLDCPKAGVTPCLTYSVVFVLFHLGVGVFAALIVDRIINRGGK